MASYLSRCISYSLNTTSLGSCLFNYVDVHVNNCVFPTDAVPFINAHFGAGAGPIHFSSVHCTGSEGNFIDCPHSSNVQCGHNEDAGVRCQGRLRDVVGSYSNQVL